MTSRNEEMRIVFELLSEKNKDLVLAIAQKVKDVQDSSEQKENLPENTSNYID